MFVVYVADTETTGITPGKNDVIELSLYRLSDNVQKTWTLRPFDFSTIEADALRVNGHKLEDIRTYPDASEVLIEVENFLMEDGVSASERVLCGQNIQFDIDHLKALWKKCGQENTYPFSYHTLDTKMLAFFIDYCTGNSREKYNLKSLATDFGVKMGKAHRAEEDTRATKELFVKQVEFVKNGFKSG